MPRIATLRLIVGALAASWLLSAAGAAPADPAPEPLFETIAALDNAVFEAFNHCQDPVQLKKHASYFAAGVEFYHDTGGVTWSRDAMIANTRKYVCGNYRRERVAGTLKVYPVKDFGAIAEGTHRFCSIASGNCEGLADFAMVWQQHKGSWRITRVLSYGHRPNPVADTATSATTETAPPMVGGDRDAHGCIASAGYSWCATTGQCERPWELAAQKGFELSAQSYAQYCQPTTP